MVSAPYIPAHMHNTIGFPFGENSNYDYNTPTTNPAANFNGQHVQVQFFHPPMTGFIDPTSPYGQYAYRDPFSAPSPTFNDYTQHANTYHQEQVPTQTDYYWDGALRRFSPSSGSEVSRRVPRGDCRVFEGLLLRPRANHNVTNLRLALRFVDRDWLDIYFLRTLIELAAFLFTVLLTLRWLSIIPCGSTYSQKRNKKHQRLNFSNSLLVALQVMLCLQTKETMDNG